MGELELDETVLPITDKGEPSLWLLMTGGESSETLEWRREDLTVSEMTIIDGMSLDSDEFKSPESGDAQSAVTGDTSSFVAKFNSTVEDGSSWLCLEQGRR